MRMLILTAAAALTLSGTAQAQQTKRFAYQGETFDYVMTDKGSIRVITGKRGDGTPFRLVVRGDRVRGTIGRQDVSFALSDVEPRVARQNAALAAR